MQTSKYNNHLHFLKQVFKAINENKNIEELLKNNKHLINEDLLKYLSPCFDFYVNQGWSKKLLIKVIQKFASYIQNFPYGNQSLNIELAIQFLEFDLKLIHCDTESDIGIKLHCLLTVLYCDRKLGDPLENKKSAFRNYEMVMDLLGKNPELFDSNSHIVNDSLFKLQYLDTNSNRENSQLYIEGDNKYSKILPRIKKGSDTWIKRQIEWGEIKYRLYKSKNNYEHLREALSLYEETLTFCDDDTHLKEWGQLKTKIGWIYYEIAREIQSDDK